MKKNNKKFKIGMYGAKLMPMHKGHLRCLATAAAECEKVYFIMFINGDQEDNIHKAMPNDPVLSIEYRTQQMNRAAAMFDNVEPVVIDISTCRNPDGSEDWDAETPLVLHYCGHLDAVYGSEPQYKPYFDRAYPGAIYRCLDPERKTINISSTAIREMSYNERKEWMV